MSDKCKSVIDGIPIVHNTHKEVGFCCKPLREPNHSCRDIFLSNAKRLRDDADNLERLAVEVEGMSHQAAEEILKLYYKSVR